ncbi:MAG: hypothetical protein P1V97_37295 [Planctomycetota bacterium]|nr:hypothetical protein [Planctomycetota bacterium]
MSRGEFTRKFDREIMKDESVEKEELASLQRSQNKEKEAIEVEFQKLSDILDHRALWLHDRFANIKEPSEIDFRGRRFEFPQSPDSVGVGWLEFRSRLTDTALGIILECYMGISGRFKKRYDYITFPKENVNEEKAKKFIESKIFEFAGAWQV